MESLQIIKFPSNILITKTESITNFDKNLENIVNQLANLMYSLEGAGIAANQAGLSLNLFIIDNQWFKKGCEKKHQVFVNPEILNTYGETINWEEGCLSFEGIKPNVPRYKKIKVKYQDLNGNITEEMLEGDRLDMVHRFQHEYDHVNGKTFLDNLTKAEQETFLKEGGLNLSKVEFYNSMKRFDNIRNKNAEQNL